MFHHLCVANIDDRILIYSSIYLLDFHAAFYWVDAQLKADHNYYLRHTLYAPQYISGVHMPAWILNKGRKRYTLGVCWILSTVQWISNINEKPEL